MSISSKVAHELNDADEMILDELASGRNLPQNLANELGYSRQYVQNRLQMLKAADYVENVGGGLYELLNDPRDDGAGEEDVEELKQHVRAAGEAIEGQDVDALRRHVRAACEAIDDE